MNTQALEKEKEKLTIVVTEPSEFNNIIKVALITSNELMEKVSEVFSPVYKDYAGCYIAPRINGMGFDCKLYFCAPSIENEGATIAFDLNNNGQRQQKTGLIAGLASIERRSKQNLYTLTQHGKEGLIDFIEINNRNATPDWNKYVFEEMQNSNINRGVYAVVTNIDVNKLLAAVYGEKEDGKYVQYSIQALKPLSAMSPQSPASNWMLKIERLNMKELDKLSSKIGLIQNGGIPMVPRR